MDTNKKLIYLKSYNYLQLEIERIDEELTRWRSRAQTTGFNMSKERTTQRSSGSSIEISTEKIDLLMKRLSEKLEALVEMRYEIGATIDNLENDIERELLKRRYINGDTLEEIAEAMFYSDRQLRRIHAAALEKLYVEEFSI